MFKIGDFSKLTRVSARMLRYYDEAGIFKPAIVDQFTSYRYYSSKQIEKLNFIVFMRDAGFNISEIAIMLNEKNQQKQIEMMQARKNQILLDIKKAELALDNISSYINNIGKENLKMSYKVEIKSIPSYKVVSLRDTIGAYNQEGVLWQKLGEYVEKKHLECEGVAFATYHDAEFKDTGVDIEVCMQIDNLKESEDSFVFKQTEELNQCACILVPGDYSNIAPAFEYIAKWIEEKGYMICGNAIQFSIRGPWNADSPDDYLVEIVFPVCK